jgi:hypothetical protein
MSYYRKVKTAYGTYRENQPTPQAVPPTFSGALGYLTDKSTPIVVADKNEVITPAIKHVAAGNFKEYYRAVIPNDDGSHCASIIATTFCGYGPAEYNQEMVEFLIEDAKCIAWRWPGDAEWDFDFTF